MAVKTIYHTNILTGGAATALDSFDGNSLSDKDRAFTIVGDVLYVHELDADSGLAENSPGVIAPDTNAGTKRWILLGTRYIDAGLTFADLGTGFSLSGGTTLKTLSVPLNASLPGQDTGAAAPVGGTWAAGWIRWFTSPAEGGAVGAVCVTAGTPGEWRPFGFISGAATPLDVPLLLNPKIMVETLDTVEINAPTLGKARLRWGPVDAVTSNNLVWEESHTRSANTNTGDPIDNQIHQWSFNVGPGGVLLDANYSGMRDAFEAYYTPVSIGAGWIERHIGVIVPTDYVTTGEIRSISIWGNVHVGRDSVENIVQFNAKEIQFLNYTEAGYAHGDVIKFTLGGAPNYAGTIQLYNAYSTIVRLGVPNGTPLLSQSNAAATGSLAAISFDDASNIMRLNVDNQGGPNEVRIGTWGTRATLFLDGKYAADEHTIIGMREQLGGTLKISMVALGSAAMYLCPPFDDPYSAYPDATIEANAKVTIKSDGKVGIGTIAPTSPLQVVGVPVYANNAAAVAGGLTEGAFYRTGGNPDPVCVVHA